jgi:hypothetical protein
MKSLHLFRCVLKSRQVWNVADLAGKIAHVSVGKESPCHAVTLEGSMFACPSWHVAVKFIAAVAYRYVCLHEAYFTRGTVSAQPL